MIYLLVCCAATLFAALVFLRSSRKWNTVFVRSFSISVLLVGFFQIASSLRLGHLDPFFLVATGNQLVVAYGICLLVGAGYLLRKRVGR